ncbi:AfsA-related hotdog domain-containing protein [Calidifontibacter indicus]|uniref:A-factor biosynthesis hotdog protein n=1 Tax=Calidifontibacter indicus TaxID=419650 RepID=A0A3D9UI51_9MICO|nr:A-factor biosynthesis hotdog protein [Calidifontibacter indicus]
MGQGITAGGPGAPIHGDGWSCVDRRLVHRASISEVFVTMLRDASTGWLVDVQWPREHPLYIRSDHYSPTIFLESFRQAVILASHVVSQVPLDAAFLMNAIWIEIPDPRVGGGPTRSVRPAITDSAICGHRSPGRNRVDGRVQPPRSAPGTSWRCHAGTSTRRVPQNPPRDGHAGEPGDGTARPVRAMCRGRSGRSGPLGGPGRSGVVRSHRRPRPGNGAARSGPRTGQN